MAIRPATFVFAVCGPAKEIETLNFSLPYLRRFTSCPIRVVTDLSRNEAEIKHDDVIDYRTPRALSHHQAAILLKTGLHRILPMPGTYCHLDSDVIAVRPGVDEVFAHKRISATFATEWTRMPQFSGYAIHCSCVSTREAEIERLLAARSRMVAQRDIIAAKWEALQNVIARFDVCSPELEAERAFLRYAVRRYWYSWEEAKKIGTLWKDFISSRGGTLSQLIAALGYRWNEEERAGYDSLGRLVWAEDTVRSVQRVTNCAYDSSTERWIDPEGYVLDTALIDTKELDDEIKVHSNKGCDHLRQAIRARFGVEVTDPCWRHWNSGVFVFDDRSVELLDLWHDFSKSLFNYPEWINRDQGTLIAAVWKLGLERQGNLPIHFNFLADYNRTDLNFNYQSGFSFDGSKEHIQPFFVHIYHHFGDRSWPVWKWIECIGANDEIPEFKREWAV